MIMIEKHIKPILKYKVMFDDGNYYAALDKGKIGKFEKFDDVYEAIENLAMLYEMIVFQSRLTMEETNKLNSIDDVVVVHLRRND